jgi:Domain of unknown function (DUF222)
MLGVGVVTEVAAEMSKARTLGARLAAFARLENAACAARLSVMADMLAAAHAADGSADREQWRLDNWAAVCAQIGAAHAVTSGVACGLLTDAVTVRERLPQVGALFAAGGISYRLVHLICSRTLLVTDPYAIKALDADLADLLAAPVAMSVSQAEQTVDALVVRHDRFAIRRTQTASRGCHVDIVTENGSGVAYLEARLLATDGTAFDQRLDALARTVCGRDPRTVDQRRAAAVGALGFGWDRLPCLCETDDCDAATKPAGGGVVIHVVAHTDTTGTDKPSTPESEGPTPAEPEADREPEVEPTVESAPDADPTTENEPKSAAVPADLSTEALAVQRRGLVGGQRLLPKPWYTHNWSELLSALNADPGQRCPAPPGVIRGGPVLPAPIVAQIARHATVTTVRHPGHAPPEPRYRPSSAWAQFVRCRDLTCRFPGCNAPAEMCDLDHTVPWPNGPTHPSNVKLLCRQHHLLKTFFDWVDRQLPDGTVVWTSPDGETYVTHPGSRMLFPSLCEPTATVSAPAAARKATPNRSLMMPRRKNTRAHDRTRSIEAERALNREDLETACDDVSFLPSGSDQPTRLAM